MNQITPHITEKSFQLASAEVPAFTFKVTPGLRKEAIARAVEQHYKVTVTDIQTINLPRKVRRFKGILGHTKPVHKAIIRLKAGERIADFDPAVDASAAAN